MRLFSSALAAACAALAVFTSAASASDFGQRYPTPIAYNWSGAYVGINAGYTLAPVGADASIGGTTIFSSSVTTKGFVGGGQIGYDRQFGQIVAGIVVDGDLSTARGSLLGVVDIKNKDFLSVRGRLGWAFMPDTMIYGTAGIGWGKATASAVGGSASSEKLSGPVYGLGMEHLITQKWSLQTEWKHFAFKNKVYDLGFGLTETDRYKADVITVGLNYRF